MKRVIIAGMMMVTCAALGQAPTRGTVWSRMFMTNNTAAQGRTHLGVDQGATNTGSINQVLQHDSSRSYWTGTPTVSSLTITQAAWDDVRIPMASVRLGASAPDYATFKGSTRVIRWNDSGEKSVEWEVQVPHGLNTNNVYGVKLHLHWTSAVATTGAVWAVEWVAANPGAAYGNSVTNKITATNTLAYKHTITGLLTLSNLVESAVVVGRLWRDTTDTSTDDLYGLSLDAHYVRRQLGSAAEMGDF